MGRGRGVEERKGSGGGEGQWRRGRVVEERTGSMEEGDLKGDMES
jgi:hypothetical protein